MSTRTFAMLACLSLALLLSPTVLGHAVPEELIELPQGVIQGAIEERARVFRGIPFAHTGRRELRFENPQPAKKWRGVRDASNWNAAPGCAQRCSVPWFGCAIAQSESCSYLNVFTPLPSALSGIDDAKLPVIIFWHGGHFQTGSAGAVLYDGQWYANQTKTIMVTANYRLGLYGYMASSKAGFKGNYGLHDQIAALKWIRDNIAKFGGDPDRVTISGQSAGGSSVAALLSSRLSIDNGRPLYRRAVLLSKPWGLRFLTTAEFDQLEEKNRDLVGCDGLTGAELTQCWKQTSVPNMDKATVTSNTYTEWGFFRTFYAITPVVDGDVMTKQPWEEFSNGDIVPGVDILMGDVEHEGHVFVNEIFDDKVPGWTAAIVLGLAFGSEHVEKIVDLYPLDAEDARPQISEIAGDYLFYCAARKVMRRLSNHRQVWSYRFNHVMSFPGWPRGNDYCNKLSCHGGELAFFFADRWIDPVQFPFNEPEVKLMHQFAGSVANFVHSGDPNGANSGSEMPRWPKFNGSAEGNVHMEFATPNAEVMSPHKRDKFCDMFDTIGYQPERVARRLVATRDEAAKLSALGVGSTSARGDF